MLCLYFPTHPPSEVLHPLPLIRGQRGETIKGKLPSLQLPHTTIWWVWWSKEAAPTATFEIFLFFGVLEVFILQFNSQWVRGRTFIPEAGTLVIVKGENQDNPSSVLRQISFREKHKWKLRIWKLISLQLSIFVHTSQSPSFQGFSHLSWILEVCDIINCFTVASCHLDKKPYGQSLEGCHPSPRVSFHGELGWGEDFWSVEVIFFANVSALELVSEWEQISLSSCPTGWHLDTCLDSFLELVS